MRIVIEGLDENRDYVNLFTFDNDTREVPANESDVLEANERKAFLCTNQTKDDLYYALDNLPQAASSIPSNITKAIETAIQVEQLVR